MYRIFANEKDFLEWKKEVPKELKNVICDSVIGGRILEQIEILDTCYGSERDLETDLGGFVVLLTGKAQEAEKHFKTLLARLKLQEEDYEYSDTFHFKKWGQRVQFRLYLCSCDYGVEIVMVTDEREGGKDEND